MSRSIPGQEPANLWSLFALLTATNAVLSYAPIPLVWKVLLGVPLLLFPLVRLVRDPRPTPEGFRTILRAEAFPRPHWGWLGSVLVLGAFLRLWDLTSLSGFPTMDESWLGGLALHRFERWDGSLLVSWYQQPPAYFWGQALLFRWLGPSLSSFWLFPALCSILTLGIGYWAARGFFSPSFSLLILVLASLDYWLLWSGRLSEPVTALAVPVACLVLGCLGRTLKARGEGRQGLWPLVLGALAGLGLYTTFVAAVLTGVVSLTVAWMGWRSSKDRKALWLGYGFGLLTALPLVMEAFLQGWGRYPSSLWVGAASPGIEAPWKASLSHVTALFWGAKDWTYWGGLLNPVASSLAFLGFVLLVRSRSLPFSRWMLFSGGVFLLPGLMTNNFEPFREILLAPWLLVVEGMGLVWLAGTGKRFNPRGRAAVLVLAGAAFNLFHLWGPYQEAWGKQGPQSSRFKPIEAWRAYDLLRDKADREGPGLVFTDLHLETDPALRIAVFPFNALDNRRIPAGGARWAALWVDGPWAAPLAARIPGGQWHWLSDNLPPRHGGAQLVLFPLLGKGPLSLRRWELAQEGFRQVDGGILEGRGPSRLLEALDSLKGKYGDFKDDPFLESLYWGKVRELRLKSGDLEGALEANESALKRGFPVAYSYHRKGILLEALGRGAQAQEAFQKARELAGGK